MLRVLIVEDERTTRTLLTEILASRGCDVTACTTAEDGWQAFADGEYPLVLLNWMLPGMSGIDLCRKLRTDDRGKDAVILIITGRSEAGALERVLEAGADDYLAKPFEVGILKVRLCIAEQRVRDLDVRREAERERARFEELVQHRQRLESLGVMAGGIAHDFNNLLVGILGYTHLAIMDLESDAPMLARLRQIEATTTKASELTSQLLAYSGRGNLQTATVDLNDVAPEMAALLEVSKAKGAELTYDLADEELRTSVDATQVRQVIMNLVTNASDAIGGGEGTIHLSTGRTVIEGPTAPRDYFPSDVAAGEYVFVQVRDSGCGMDAETRARMFDPFFTTKTHGRGLGLASAMGIIRSHRGALYVRSRPGRGTTIRVLLPVERRKAPREDPAFTHLLSGVPSWTGTGLVLIVDDEENVRAVASQLVARLGFDVATARHSDEALDFFHRRATDLRAVILDIGLPGTGGIGVLARIREFDPTMPVVLCSGGDPEAATGPFGASNGPTAFLRKPFRPGDLATALKSVVEVAAA